MLSYQEYVSSRGEFWVQDIIEKLEHREGIRSRIGVPLEDRWNSLMQDFPFQQRLAA